MIELASGAAGLTAEEAHKRLALYGPNALTAHTVNPWRILARQFKSSFVYLLFGAAALSFGLGEKIDGIIVVAFILINATLGFLEEYHSERSVELLKKYVVASVRVRRGGAVLDIPAPQIVPGDVVLLTAGDILPADVRFINTTALVINESLLTGESVPVEKRSEAQRTPAEAVHEATTLGFSGSAVTAGSAEAVVLATGSKTEFGTVAALTTETRRVSGFEKGIAKFSSFILKMILTILVILFVVNLILKGGHTNIFELLLFSIALAVSVVPEALPVVTTIALSKGAKQLADHSVVVKRLTAVEDLGSIEILCSDKTGTLTENKLAVREVYGTNKDAVIRYASLGIVEKNDTKKRVNNSFDLAILQHVKPENEHEMQRCSVVAEIPFDPDRKRASVLVECGGDKFIIVRGAEEEVVALCPAVTTEQKKEILAFVETAGKRGERVIAIAHKDTTRRILTKDDEALLAFDGLLSFVDPIKPSAKEAVEAAKQLGVVIKMLTGDSASVAGSVAYEVGLTTNKEAVITGAQFMALSNEERKVTALQYNVFARVAPAEKYAIIEALQAAGKEVGFLGEGINDAPALRVSDVGIVVSDASDIARDAADIVLLEKSLSVLVDGVREGREIFSNTVKYIKATLISNFGNFYAIAIATLLIPFLPMLPVQILLLNLLSDFPMIAIATDSVDAFELRRPRSYNLREVILIALLLGLVSTIFDFIFFALFKSQGAGPLQTYWFVGSVLTELTLIFSIRTRRVFWRAKAPRPALIGLSIISTALSLLLPFTAFGQHTFLFIHPTVAGMGTVVAVVIAYFFTSELVKNLYYRFAYRTDSRGEPLPIV